MRRTYTATSRVILPVLVAALAGVMGSASPAWAHDLGEFEAALLRCADVNRPVALTGCGTDPLGAGEAEIRPDGRVEVKVTGAVPSASYAVVLRSLDAVIDLPLGTLVTNGAGDGELELSGVLRPGDAGSGSVILRRGSADQFVTGFRVSGGEASARTDDPNDEAKLEAVLVRCGLVNVPGALGGCGIDSLLAGAVEIDEEGQVEIEVVGAPPSARYSVVLRSPAGLADLPLGTLTTDGAGNGEVKLEGAFGPGTVGAGAVVLRREGADQFVSGFHVLGIIPRKFEAAVVHCAAVNQPAALAGCGTDPLKTGKVQIRLDGRVKVDVVHGSPHTSYDVVLRPPDGIDMPLGTLVTNPAGNGKLKIAGTFVPGDVVAGNVVVRRADTDQFVSGFRVRGPHTRRFRAALVACAEVNRPAALTGCGADPLLAGDAEIRLDGRVEVEVVGAVPSARYSVLLRSLDGAAELLLGVLGTSAAGHGELKANGVFVAGDIGSGNVVLRREGADQFVSGFRVQAADVPHGHWARAWIEALFRAQVTGGCASDPLLYCPESSVSRAQMAVFVLRGRHGPGYVPPAPTGMFDDVPRGHWAAAWIERLAREGIAAGCGGGRFCPESSVTRAQMAVFLLRAARVGPQPHTGVFEDVPPEYWAATWIEALVAQGITAGCRTSPPLFCPDESVTRGQMAVFLVKTFNLPL